MIGISPRHVFTAPTEFKFHCFIFLKSFSASVIFKKSLIPVCHVRIPKKGYDKIEKEVSHKRQSSFHLKSHLFHGSPNSLFMVWARTIAASHHLSKFFPPMRGPTGSCLLPRSGTSSVARKRCNEIHLTCRELGLLCMIRREFSLLSWEL